MAAARIAGLDAFGESIFAKMKGRLSRYINRLVTFIKFNPLEFVDFFEFRSLDGRFEDCLGLIKVRDAKAKSHLAHFRVRNVQFGISLHQDCTIKSIAAFLKSSTDKLKS